MYQIEPIRGVSDVDCYVVIGAHSAVVVDTGYACCAESTVAQLKRILGGLPLRYIFLTHSHFDHLGAAAAVKRHFPEAIVVGSERIAQIMQSQTACKTMQALDDVQARLLGLPAVQGEHKTILPDLPVGDCKRFDWDGDTITAMSTPGHTRCSVSFFFVRQRILAAAESVGIAPFFPLVFPAFITGYKDALQSMEKCKALPAGVLLLSHSPMISGENAKKFWTLAQSAAYAVKNFVESLAKQGYAADEIVNRYCRDQYTSALAKVQSKDAFMLNTQAMIVRLLPELGFSH